MKKNNIPPFLISALILTLFFTTSCNSPKPGSDQPVKDTASSGSNLMDEGPAYDAHKIDPNATVEEVVLKATGNSMTEMKYDLTEIKVKEGSTIKLTLVNEAKDASMIHNFVLIDEGTADKVGPEGVKAGPEHNYTPSMNHVLTGTKMVNPGEQTEITFPAPPKGTYDFICTYPGHYTMMHGKFIVS